MSMDEETIKQIASSIEEEKVIKLTKDLIEIPSHLESEGRETGVVNYIASYLKNLGCEVTMQELEENRGNVIGVLKGKGTGDNLMLNGHMDTVPPAGMKDPYTPRVEDNKLFGRGSCDMKGAVAAMLVAMEKIANSDSELSGDLILATTVEEETGAIGMDHMMKNRPFEADYCVTGEPTSLDLGVTHKGIEWLQVDTKGTPAHGSTPEEGVNAISKMASFIRHFEEDLLPKLKEKEHPLLGNPTANIGRIEGGDEINIVPGKCTVQIDRRWIPDESIEGIIDEVEEVIERTKLDVDNFEAELSRIEKISRVWHGPFEASENNPVVGLTEQLTEQFTSHSPEKVGLGYWTDGALAQKNGIETLIYGPGNASQAHTENEYVELNKLIGSARVYTALALNICT